MPADPQTTDYAVWLRENAPPGPLGKHMVAAAAEIERLQAALLRIRDFRPTEGAGDPYVQMASGGKQIAREALADDE